jgi:hypothetical protein
MSSVALLLDLYAQRPYLLRMVELPPDVAVFAAVRDGAGCGLFWRQSITILVVGLGSAV